MSASRQQVKGIAAQLGKGERTIWRWISQGLDISSPGSVQQFAVGKQLRRSNFERSRERVERAFASVAGTGTGAGPKAKGSGGGGRLGFLIGAGDLPVPGRRGAAAALERLEAAEERAHARLLAGMAKGDPFQIEALQDFWLKCSETLRKLDLAVEMARRDAEETMHGAKGLSSKVVFIPSLEQGVMPSFRALHAVGLLIEHRRLFYVSVTRAMAACIITHAALHTGPNAFRLRQRPSVRLPRSEFLNQMFVPSVNRAGGLTAAEAVQIVADISNL